jgi:hypothetical protein
MGAARGSRTGTNGYAFHRDETLSGFTPSSWITTTERSGTEPARQGTGRLSKSFDAQPLAPGRGQRVVPRLAIVIGDAPLSGTPLSRLKAL